MYLCFRVREPWLLWLCADSTICHHVYLYPAIIFVLLLEGKIRVTKSESLNIWPPCMLSLTNCSWFCFGHWKEIKFYILISRTGAPWKKLTNQNIIWEQMIATFFVNGPVVFMNMNNSFTTKFENSSSLASRCKPLRKHTSVLIGYFRS